MRISVTAPIELALNHTKAILFDTFRFRMWLGLGFCAFLNGLFGRFNISGNFRLPSSSRGSSPGSPSGPDLSKPIEELRTFLIGLSPGMLAAGIGILLVILLITVLLAWLQSRGAFMFLDGVLVNEGAVREPWRRFRYLGNSVFRLQLALIAVAWGLMIPLVLLILMRFVFNDRFESLNLLLLVLLAFVVVLSVFYALATFIVQALLREFVVPTMYRRNLLVSDAWRVLRTEILPGRLGTLVLFFLMRFLLAMAAGIIMMIGACVTCCLGALPYISSVLFLPIHVFFRLYSVYFLEQFGPDWWFFAREDPDSGGEGGQPEATLDGPVTGDSAVSSSSPPFPS